MLPTVRRFWFEFDLPSPESQRDPTFACLSLGVGVTGFDVADCLWMIRDLLPTLSVPPIRTVTPDVSLAKFAPRVLGLGVPVWRGVCSPRIIFVPQGSGGRGVRPAPLIRRSGRRTHRALGQMTPLP